MTVLPHSPLAAPAGPDGDRARVAGRTIAIWSPDWPVVTAAAAAGLSPQAAAAVLEAGVVLACTAGARAAGVRRGLRRREAQHRCPELAVLTRDTAEEARAFEPVVVAVEAAAPGVQILRPGLCTVSAPGPARYFGGDGAAAAHLAEQASVAGPGDRCRAGVAEGAFAATLAARAAAVVPAGSTPEFLADFPIEALERPALADLLRRLGVHTLGAFAALPAPDVTARFGADGAYAHRLARGLDPQPPFGRTPPPDLMVAAVLDPPAARVEQAAFAARPLADRLHARLAAAGLGCTRISIEIETEHSERHTRIWRHEGVLNPDAIAERVRWQLDGWLNARPSRTGLPARPSGGVAVLRLTPEEVIPHGGDQLGLWSSSGADTESAQRARRAVARVQGLLGQPAVLTASLDGGRGPGEQVRYRAWGDPPVRPGPGASAPWPGRIPAPSPAVVPPIPLPAVLLDDVGMPVRVSTRFAISAPPARLRVGEAPVRAVLGWAGPWPVEDRWWDPRAAAGSPVAHGPRVRIQLSTVDGAGWLMVLAGDRWWVEAVYD